MLEVVDALTRFVRRTAIAARRRDWPFPKYQWRSEFLDDRGVPFRFRG
jgi:hypothetical protein